MEYTSILPTMASDTPSLSYLCRGTTNTPLMPVNIAGMTFVPPAQKPNSITKLRVSVLLIPKPPTGRNPQYLV